MMIRLTTPELTLEIRVVKGPPSEPDDEHDVWIGCHAKVYVGGLSGDFQVDIQSVDFHNFHKELSEMVDEVHPECSAQLCCCGDVDMEIKITMKENGQIMGQFEFDVLSLHHSATHLSAEFEMNRTDLVMFSKDVAGLIGV
jgi:hypothetical protein